MPQWIELPDETATQKLGAAFGRSLSAGSVLLLNGDLGSGKTTLIQSLGASLGITEPIVSPTFTLVSEYSEGRIPLYHFDLYRLHPEEVAELALETYWEGSEYPLGIVAIEWAERLPYLPSEYLALRFTMADLGRRVELAAVDDHHQQMLQQVLTNFGESNSLFKDA